MIVEMSIYDIQPPASVNEYKQAFEAGLTHRSQFSKLGGFWHVEFGPLNRVIHLWEYDSLEERNRVQEASAKEGVWPPPLEGQVIAAQETKILKPAPFSPRLVPAQLGGVYEFRTYTVRPGAMDEFLRRWVGAVDERLKFSPLAFAGHTIVGPLNQYVHVWPYKDVNDRMRVRDEANGSGRWNPHTRELVVKQESVIAVPADFSPLA